MGKITRRKASPSKATWLVATAAATVAFSAGAFGSSPGFPGTIQPPPYPSNNKDDKDRPNHSNQGSSSSSDDEAGEAGESSSDWDDALIMEEDPLAFVVEHVDAMPSLSSDGDHESETDGERVVSKPTTAELNQSKGEENPRMTIEPTSNEKSSTDLAAPPPPPALPSESEKPEDQTDASPISNQASQTYRKDRSEEKSSKDESQQHLPQEDPARENDAHTDETRHSETPKPSRRGNRNSKVYDRHPSNKKPLQTLEKLQQLLDETDYLTSSSSAEPQNQQNQQQQHKQSSTKSTVPGIDSLWTSKDRTKYKKQQRLQKEQIRLKQQQEEQLRKQQQQQQHQYVAVETEELSETDDGLGYTLPNLPVYLSDGEEDTDEVLFLSDPTNSARGSTSTSQQKQQKRQVKTLAQQQYLQQQRDLFFAQEQQQQQQQQYPNQQQQQQHPYYGAGPYPPPPPMGFYPYGPPPPTYYNSGPLPHPQQYYPSSYYPYRIPRIDPTVPRNPRQGKSTSPSSSGNQQQSQPDRSLDSTANEDSNKLENSGINDETTASQGGVLYAQPHAPFDASYYPQSPEQQEQWHLQQLRILQTQEKLRRKHQTMVLMATFRSVAMSTWKTLGSCRKMSTCLALVACTCYAGVSPRNLSYLEYNQRFYENLKRMALVVLPPLIGYGWLIVDWNQLKLQLIEPEAPTDPAASVALTNGETNSLANKGGSVLEADSESLKPAGKSSSLLEAIHVLIHSFYSSFVFGYPWVFVLEIAWTTFLRLVIFLAWEPDMFGLKLPWSSTPISAFDGTEATPPFLILPWVLREFRYRPKRITLLAADILTSCVACPIVEEFAKLRLLQWTMPLSKNFSWVQKPSKNHKKTKMIAEPITATSDETGTKNLDGTVTNINPYISGMLAVSLGIKLADAIRRVCMYTKVQDEQKNVYAFLRGMFPVQELCGIMTALGLARRDILGQKMPLWKLLLPAVFVHSMANLRGMKPIFKWNSSTPWAEMQLSPDLFPKLFSPSALSAMEDAGVTAPLPPTTKLQWLGKAFPKIMWVIILMRATGYCAKNYFMINRQAVRRATTYAGKHAAFSAELETAQKLKNTKDK